VTKNKLTKLEVALQSSEQGSYEIALKNVKEESFFDDGVIKKLFDALISMQDNWKKGNSVFRDYFDWLCSKSVGMNVVYPCFDGISKNIQPILEKFEYSGDGKFNFFSGLELVTIADQKCTLSLTDPNLVSKTQVLHFLAAFPSNVGDQFFVNLKGKSRLEAIRFSNGGISIVQDNSIIECDTRTLKLYSIVLYPGSLHFYINGIVHQIKKRNPNFEPINTISIELLGDNAADLGGIIYGLEFWKSDIIVDEIFGDNKQLYIKRLKYQIEQNQPNKIYRLLCGIDNDWTQELTSELLNYLDNMLSSKKGFQEWLFSRILDKVRKNDLTSWKEKLANRIPNPILRIKNVTAEFMVSPNKTFSIMSILRKKGRQKFLALDNINFDIYPGDIVGIIGENGAGKSTLLKTIAGLVPINKGLITLKAKHMLLSPGLGVRNELTGRENAYLAGVFMGLSKYQMDSMIDEIIDFSELGDSIDKPFKYYSDGMKGRLVFSLATSVSPDLLMLDELLSAGDIKFQAKAAYALLLKLLIPYL